MATDYRELIGMHLLLNFYFAFPTSWSYHDSLQTVLPPLPPSVLRDHRNTHTLAGLLEFETKHYFHIVHDLVLRLQLGYFTS